MRKQVEKNIEELDKLIKELRAKWDTASEFNLHNIKIIFDALDKAIAMRDDLKKLLDILKEGV